jgi:HAMP domain-containing protein
VLIGLALAALLLRTAARLTARKQDELVPVRIRDEQRRP